MVGGWWRLAVDGSWRLAVGGPLGRSLAKKKIWSFKDRPALPVHAPVLWAESSAESRAEALVETNDSARDSADDCDRDSSEQEPKKSTRSKRTAHGPFRGVLRVEERLDLQILVRQNPAPFVKNERTNDAGLAKVAHEKQWTAHGGRDYNRT